MLQDTFGRQFHYLRLSITDVCNFRCNYCLPEGYKKDGSPSFLTREEIRLVASAFATCGTSKIRITGGEPSLRKDLPEIISDISALNDVKQIALTTNGYKLDQRIDSWVNAGLTQLNVSIDSLDKNNFERITGHDRLNEIFAGLEKARQLGMTNIKINSVLMKSENAHEFPQFLDWLKTNAYTLRFIEVMQTNDNEVFFRQNHLSGGLIKAQLLEQGWQQVLRDKTAGPAQEFWHPDYAGRIGLIMPYSKDFCDSCNRLRVSAMGKLHLCLFGDQGFDIRHLLQSEDQRQELVAHLQNCLSNKKATHFLQQGETGITTNLSMLGG